MFPVVVLIFGTLCASVGLGADCFPTSKIRFGRTYSSDGKFASKSKQLGEGYKMAIAVINAAGGVKCGDKTYEMELLQANEIDAKSNDVQTTAGTRKLIEDGNIDLLLAPYSSGLSGAASEVTGDKGWVIVYSGASADSLFESAKDTSKPYDPDNNDKYGKYNFGLFTRASKYQEAVVQALTGKDVKKVCILCRDPAASTFPQKVALGALALAKGSGITVVSNDETDVMYHKEGADAEIEIQAQLQFCRKEGAEAILANTNAEADAEHYVNAARHAFGQNNPWWPKIMSITVYAAEPLFINNMGEDALHILGPTQWTVDAATRPDNAKNNGDSLFGNAKDVAKEYISRYGSTPSYQAAGAIASVLVFKLAIEGAAKANPGVQLTQAMIGDAILAFDNLPSFFADLTFKKNGLLVTKDGAEKPMYTTQIQLTTTGEIPVVLPSQYASSNEASKNEDKFAFEYPSLKYISQMAGKKRGMDETKADAEACQADLKAANAANENCDDGDDDSTANTLMIIFAVLTGVLLIALLAVLFMERSGEPCCAPKRMPQGLA